MWNIAFNAALSCKLTSVAIFFGGYSEGNEWMQRVGFS
jgi:hypothetical protein